MKLAVAALICCFPFCGHSQSLTFEKMLGVPPTAGEFLTITDIAIGPSGNLYVLDGFSRSVQVFNEERTFLLKFGEYGNSEDKLKIPVALAVDGDGMVYIVDSGQQSVKIFDALGVFQDAIEISGVRNFVARAPNGIWVDGDGKIYVTDNSETVSVFGPEHNLLIEYGSRGSGNGQLSEPSDIVTDLDGNMYVVDSGNNRVQVFSPSGSFLRKFGLKGVADGAFDQPTKISIDENENLFVTDFFNDRVQVFSKTGIYIKKISTDLPSGYKLISPNAIQVGLSNVIHFAGDASEIYTLDETLESLEVFGTGLLRDGQLTNPYSVSVNYTNGNITMLDIEPARVQTFDAEGNFISGFSLNSPYEYSSLAVSVSLDGSIYVADIDHDLVHKYDSEGGYLLSFGGPGTDEGKFQSPRHISVAKDGKVYVSDDIKGTVQIFTSEGVFLKQFGKKGTNDGEFWQVSGMAWDDSGQIYVGDRSLGRVQVFDSDGIFKRAISLPGVFEIFSIAVTRSGSTVYCIETGPADPYGIIVDSEGNLISEFGARGYGELELGSPRGMTLDGAGNLIIAEWGNHRVQVLKVGKSPQSISFSEISDKTNTDSPFEISVKASSKLPVTLTITEGQEIAELNGFVVQLTSQTGRVVIEAKQEGDIEFQPAEVVSREFQVVEKSKQEPEGPDIVTGIAKTYSNQISVFPNPVDTFVHLAGEEALLINKIEIIDLVGRKVLTKDIESRSSNVSIEVAGLSAGLYYLNAMTNRGLVVKRIAKSR